VVTEGETMLEKILLVVLVAIAFLPSTNSIVFAENPNKLILEEEFLSPNIYKRNGESIPWREVKETLQSDPEASAELDISNKFKAGAIISEVGMCGLLVSRIWDYAHTNSSIDSQGKLQFMAAILAVTTLAITFQWQADSHFRKAFDAYNSKLEVKNGLSFKGFLVEREKLSLVFSF
jgi:hypothetical protein